MGSNPASNHPIAFKWITKAMERGAKVICVDPRFTQSAAKAHLYAPLRSGTDIAFLGGMIKYIFDNKLYFEEYVQHYTNATFLVNPDFKLPGDNKGVFSGLTGTKYDKATWSYQTDASGVIKKDPSMTDPRCVFQLLKKHYSRYTMEMVNKITGTPVAKLEEIYKLYGSTGKPDKSGNELYAMGWTQHTVGVQNIRTMAIIQLLLGNMGIAGGGVAAMRGEANVQGSTDQGLLFHIWPGYIGTPRGSNPTLKSFMDARTPQTKESKSPQLAEEHAQVHRELPALHVRHEHHPGGGLQLPAQARRRRRLLLAHPLRPDVQGKVHGFLRLGHEPGELRRLLQQGAPGHDEARLDGQRQPLRQRDGLLLEKPRF